MPFNGSGNFSIVNTFIPNTTILSAAVNANFTDIATGLSDCLTRDGQAGMTAAFKAIAGSLGAPGVSFTSDATAGLYLSTTGIVGLVAKSLGLLVNSSVYAATSAAVQAGGSGYAVGDTITETGGTAISQAVFTVATLSGSAVATVTVGYSGFYTVVPSNPVAQGSTSGSGTGCTLNITFATQYTRSLVTSEAGALPWQRLGSSSFVSGMMAKANSYDYLRALLQAGTGLTISSATNPPTITPTLSPPLVPNYLSGLTLSTAGSSSTFGIAAGVGNDSTNVTLMNLASAYTKTTASWVVGTGNGGLDTGAIANSTWYHVFLIERVDTGVTDILFSLDPAAPTMPTSYTLKRRIGSMKTDGSSKWVLFTQTGGTFIWNVSVADVSAISTVASRVNKVLASVPTGIVVNALFRGALSSSATCAIIFTSLQESDQTPVPAASTGIADLAVAAGGGANGVGSFARLTDTSAQIGVRASATGDNYSIWTYGWIDSRGQQ